MEKVTTGFDEVSDYEPYMTMGWTGRRVAAFSVALNNRVKEKMAGVSTSVKGNTILEITVETMKEFKELTDEQCKRYLKSDVSLVNLMEAARIVDPKCKDLKSEPFVKKVRKPHKDPYGGVSQFSDEEKTPSEKL